MADPASFSKGRGIQERMRGGILRSMAGETSSCRGLHWVDVIPRRHRRQYSLGQWQLLRVCQMTLLTIAAIPGEENLIKVDRIVSESVDREIILQFFSRVDLVDHGFHVDGFGGQLVSRAASFIVPIGIVTQDTILDILTRTSMECQVSMTTVAVLLRDNLTSSHRLAIRHRHVDNFVESCIANVLDLT